METKKPMAGEWWRNRYGVIIYVAADVSDVINCTFPLLGIDRCGDESTYTQDGIFWYDEHCLGDLIQHLPDCTGFDWVPETFPQYWTTVDLKSSIAFMKQFSATEYCFVEKDGTESPIGKWLRSPISEGRKQLTEAEALALLDPPKPVESPDDWVKQDRVPARNGIDQCWWARRGADQSNFEWWSLPDASEGKMYGDSHHSDPNLVLYIRCRRKDLPPLPDAATQPQWQTIEICGKRYEIREA